MYCKNEVKSRTGNTLLERPATPQGQWGFPHPNKPIKTFQSSHPGPPASLELLEAFCPTPVLPMTPLNLPALIEALGPDGVRTARRGGAILEYFRATPHLRPPDERFVLRLTETGPQVLGYLPGELNPGSMAILHPELVGGRPPLFEGPGAVTMIANHPYEYGKTWTLPDYLWDYFPPSGVPLEQLEFGGSVPKRLPPPLNFEPASKLPRTQVRCLQPGALQVTPQKGGLDSNQEHALQAHGNRLLDLLEFEPVLWVTLTPTGNEALTRRNIRLPTCLGYNWSQEMFEQFISEDDLPDLDAYIQLQDVRERYALSIALSPEVLKRPN